MNTSKKCSKNVTTLAQELGEIWVIFRKKNQPDKFGLAHCVYLSWQYIIVLL